MSLNKEEIKAFQNAMWEFWGGRDCPCIMCWKASVVLHEIDPRSTHRDWYKTFPNINSVPLCAECHEKAEKRVWDKSRLRQMATDRAWALEYEEWDMEHPIRVSKSARPDHVVDGRSIFTIWDKQRRGKNE